MGETIRLTAADGFEASAYKADAIGGAPRGAVVVIQEIFGVNGHIRDVCDRYAEVGYTAIAPAIYDRFEPGFETGYGPGDIARGRELKIRAADGLDNVLADIDAARAAVRDVTGKVGVMGFCFGGLLAWLSACRLNFDAASGYYGGGVARYLDEQPDCPTLLHFGRQDASIPMPDVERVIAAAHPNAAVHVYEADHGFHCDQRSSFCPHAAQVATMRTIRLFDACVGRPRP